MLFGFSCTLFLHVLPLFLSLVHNGRWTCCMRQRRGLLACRGCSVYVVSRACARVRVRVYEGRGRHGVHLRGVRCGMSAAGPLAVMMSGGVAGLTCAGIGSPAGGGGEHVRRCGRYARRDGVHLRGLPAVCLRRVLPCGDDVRRWCRGSLAAGWVHRRAGGGACAVVVALLASGGLFAGLMVAPGADDRG